MKTKKPYKIIFLLSIFTLLIWMCPLNVSASAGTIYESESNNIIDTADTTYDDYDNFGTISSTSDVDWWKYTATYTGFANIWLGNIPSGCNYDLYVYSSNGTYLGCSAKPSGTQEMVRCRVISGNTYYAKVISSVGYSGSQYKFRIKNNTLGYARIFTYNYYDGTGQLNSTSAGNNSMSHIWSMGYEGQNYINNSAQPVYDTFPLSGIFAISNHAESSRFSCNNGSVDSSLYALTPYYMNSNDRSIGSYAAGALSEVKLAIFLGCQSGAYGGTNSNLVDVTLSKGAVAAMGWTTDITERRLCFWLPKFFEGCYTDVQRNIANAATYANQKLSEEFSELHHCMENIYWGDSIASAVII